MAREPERRVLWLIGSVASVFCALLPPLARAEPPALNQKVVSYARDNLGKRVGDGSCYTLAVEALGYAGARPFPLDRTNGDYVWGERVESVKEALPGDILQFRDAEFRGKRRLSGGRWLSWRYSYAHHTAILTGVRERGKVITLLHQNVGSEGADDDEKQIVQEGTLRLDSLQKGGWVRIYRPVSAEVTRTRSDRQRSSERGDDPSSKDETNE